MTFICIDYFTQNFEKWKKMLKNCENFSNCEFLNLWLVEKAGFLCALQASESRCAKEKFNAGP